MRKDYGYFTIEEAKIVEKAMDLYRIEVMNSIKEIINYYKKFSLKNLFKSKAKKKSIERFCKVLKEHLDETPQIVQCIQSKAFDLISVEELKKEK